MDGLGRPAAFAPCLQRGGTTALAQLLAFGIGGKGVMEEMDAREGRQLQKLRQMDLVSLYPLFQKDIEQIPRAYSISRYRAHCGMSRGKKSFAP